MSRKTFDKTLFILCLVTVIIGIVTALVQGAEAPKKPRAVPIVIQVPTDPVLPGEYAEMPLSGITANDLSVEDLHFAPRPTDAKIRGVVLLGGVVQVEFKAKTPGEYFIWVDAKGDRYGEAKVKVGTSPDPSPSPDPQPSPVAKVVWAIVLDDDRQRSKLTPDQLHTLGAQEVRDLFPATADSPGGTFRVVNAKRTDLPDGDQSWVEREKGKPLPIFIVYGDNKVVYYEGPIPTAAEVKSLVTKAKGQ